MHRLIALIAVAGVIFLAGCGTGGGAGQPGGDSNSVTPAETGVGITADKTNIPDRPPDSTLYYKDQFAAGALGSYCWGSACVEAAGILVPPEKDTLTVPAGSTLEFDFGAEGPYEADSGAYPLDPKAKTLPGSGGVRFLAPDEEEPMPEPKDLKAVRADAQTRITAGLPAGEYVLSVFVDPGRGDVSYYYRLRVEPASDESSIAPPASEKEILFARPRSSRTDISYQAAGLLTSFPPASFI